MELGTTALTEAEIFYGIELLSKGRKRENLLAAAEAMFTEDFSGRVFSFDRDTARNFARIAAHRRALGKPIDHAHAQIAAITRTVEQSSRQAMSMILPIATSISSTHGEPKAAHQIPGTGFAVVPAIW
jgi:hypothetical protein